MDMKLKRFCASLLLLILPLSLAVSGCDAEEDNYASNSNVTSATQNTELKTNLTQPNQIADNAYAAEAYYQQLIAQYGENYQECLEPVAVNLDSVINSNFSETNSSEADTNSDISTLKQQNTIFVLDASDSMRVFAGSSTKFDIARAAIARFVSTFPATTQVGVTVFGDRSADTTIDPTTACAANEKMYSIVQLSGLNLAPASNSSVTTSDLPTTYKPITANLLRLNELLGDRDGVSEQNTIYLITNGTDNCSSNPIETARELHSSKTNITINVISLDENESTQKQLQAIAKSGGGEYFLARNANEFDLAFEQTKQKIETKKYSTVQLKENRTQTPTSIAPNLNQIIACTTVKMNRELGQIITQVNRLSTIQGTNLKYNNYVLARLKERQERIAIWRDRLLTNTSNPQIDLNLFRQELAQATQ
jgi:Ca-activated chloride channel homolog